MTEQPKRRGRPSVDKPQIMDTVMVDEIVAVNPTAPIAEAETPTLSKSLTDTPIDTAWDAEALGSISPAITTDESPIEEKIHELVVHAEEREGWSNEIHDAPVDGRRIMISETGLDIGSLVYWRISKVVDRKNLRYVSKGRWTDFLTKKDIEFVPQYWKPYNPEEYWPLTV